MSGHEHTDDLDSVEQPNDSHLPMDVDHVDDVEVSALDGLLCFDLYAASRAVTAAYRPILFQLGLTYPQYLVLTVLWARDECAIRYLADTLRLDHGTLTPLVHRMQDAGLVTRTRDPSDERVVVVRLAPAGAALRRHAHDVRCRIAEAMGISEGEASALQGVLRTITENAETAAPRRVRRA